VLDAIEHNVKALEEYVAINKVKPCANGCSKVFNDEIYIIGTAPNPLIERTRPDLRIRDEFVDTLCKWLTRDVRADRIDVPRQYRNSRYTVV
jgi:hypothetical protein